MRRPSADKERHGLVPDAPPIPEACRAQTLCRDGEILRDARYEDATQGGGLDTFEKILVRLPPCKRLGFGTDLIE